MRLFDNLSGDSNFCDFYSLHFNHLSNRTVSYRCCSVCTFILYLYSFTYRVMPPATGSYTYELGRQRHFDKADMRPPVCLSRPAFLLILSFLYSVVHPGIMGRVKSL